MGAATASLACEAGARAHQWVSRQAADAQEALELSGVCAAAALEEERRGRAPAHK